VLFDHVGQMYLHNSWRQFSRAHAIEVGHFFVFKYNSHSMLTVKLFDKIMYHHHYHSDVDEGQEEYTRIVYYVLIAF
jgi:co-chaperonin GroES (HSP10)